MTDVCTIKKPGDVAPNQKQLMPTICSPFNGGAAIVRKGMSYGLIDASGNFIVPYNKYRKIASGEVVGISITKSGIFIINDEEGAIDSKGKLITAAYPGKSWGYGKEDGTLIMCTNCHQAPIDLTQRATNIY